MKDDDMKERLEDFSKEDLIHIIEGLQDIIAGRTYTHKEVGKILDEQNRTDEDRTI